jgi:hypothetical protein
MEPEAIEHIVFKVAALGHLNPKPVELRLVL